MNTSLLSKSFASLVLAGSLAGCANRYHVDAEAPNYAATADLAVRVNKTEQRELTMHIEHLAPPTRIDPALHAYAVWIAVPGHGSAKLGLLDYDAKHRSGEIVATAGYEKFEVIVTLEADPSTAVPSDRVVLRKVVGKG
jgi:hypothetical protein